MAKEEVKTQKKLSYEDLKTYASQLAAQLNHVIQENNQLKQALTEKQTQEEFTVVSLALKALDHKELFSKEFTNKLVNQLEVILTPMEESKEVEDKEETKKK